MAVSDFLNPPITVIGSKNRRALNKLKEIYSGLGSEVVEVEPKVAEIIKAKTGHDIAAEDVEKVQKLASTLVIRSARLVTASFVGIIWQQAGSGKAQKQHIAIDGSVYEKMPLAKENIMRALSELLGEEAAVIDTVLENGGSGLGAAIAAAMSQK
jgi:hexokinase